MKIYIICFLHSYVSFHFWRKMPIQLGEAFRDAAMSLHIEGLTVV